MNLTVRLVFLSSLLLGVPQLSLAMTIEGQIAPRPTSIDTTRPVERGGTINIVNLTNKTILIDGVSYPLPSTAVTVHDASGKALAKSFVLKAGMQIRFSTSKKNAAAKDEIREIWLTSMDGKPNRP